MKNRKGLILSGGTGSRLYPITLGVSKQLLPIFDKPMIYYPLSVLMLTGIRDIAIIVRPDDVDQYQRLLGDGNQWGISLTYIEQPSSDGLAQAFILAEDFLDGSPSTLVLGDNLFFGHGLPELLNAANRRDGASIFAYQVSNPESYGVVSFDGGVVQSIEEKPDNPASDFAITGLYFFDSHAPTLAKKVKPSSRGELEITSLLEIYMDKGSLNVELMGRGFTWLDTGTYSNLLEAGNFVRTIEERQGLQVSNLEEIAFRQGWISKEYLKDQSEKFIQNSYGKYLKKIVNNN
ncbi:glucose-1-phosphate thymidylyltransferase RfbA [Gammaproteobacteria bacterium]|jgi:glucose-1-phosphate thymidylyltransferase|nr:glucose-1-phosphate thymidylyltransferase RfbA [Gammaproteobacteria bacterium]